MTAQRKDYSEYINQQFGELTILSISEPIKEKNSQRICVCKCSCGKEINTCLNNVLRGGSTSCGHTRQNDYSEYINKKFGELTILSISKPDKEKQFLRYCLCKCSCGKEMTTQFQGVLNGSVASCGHVRQNDYSEYVNKKFGELTILSISEPIEEKNYERICKCKCSCGKETTPYLRSLLTGDTKSCGHLIKERAIETYSEKLKLRNKRKEANVSNKSTGIKNISFHSRNRLYIVSITRKGINHSKYASSLEEAIKIKERILQDLGELD